MIALRHYHLSIERWFDLHSFSNSEGKIYTTADNSSWQKSTDRQDQNTLVLWCTYWAPRLWYASLLKFLFRYTVRVVCTWIRNKSSWDACTCAHNQQTRQSNSLISSNIKTSFCLHVNLVCLLLLGSSMGRIVDTIFEHLPTPRNKITDNRWYYYQYSGLWWHGWVVQAA